MFFSNKNKIYVNNFFARSIVLGKKEKSVLRYLCKVCTKKRTYLISPHEIASNLSKKYVLSVAEIDEIMATLSNENYLDFVISESKNDYFYCVTMKKKGLNYEANIKDERRNFLMLILRTLFLAVVSFVFGLILKAIFT